MASIDGSHDGAPTKNDRKRTKPPKAGVLALHYFAVSLFPPTSHVNFCQNTQFSGGNFSPGAGLTSGPVSKIGKHSRASGLFDWTKNR